jgi:hypothetical protein
MAVHPHSPERQADPGIIHTALLAGALFVAPLAVVLRLVFPVVDIPNAIPGLRVTALGLLVAVAIVVRVLRARIQPLAPDGDENAWWNAHLVSALAMWAAGEGVAILGSVFFFLDGDLVMLVVIGGGLLLLLWSHPGRLKEA